MTHSAITRRPESLDDLCCCDGDPIDEHLVDVLYDDDFEDDPCPDCGGRVLRYPPPIWMEEEEDDC